MERDALQHEIMVGYTLNKLKKIIPHFSFLYTFKNTFLCMEYKSGIPLFKLIQQNHSISAFIDIIIQIACSLQIAFEKYYFIHGDLTPWNILINQHEYPQIYHFPLQHSSRMISISTYYTVSIVDYEKSSILSEDIYLNPYHTIYYNSLFDMITFLLYSIDLYLVKVSDTKELDKLLYIAQWFNSLSLCIRKTDLNIPIIKHIKHIKVLIQSFKSYSTIYYHFKEMVINTFPSSIIDYLYKQYKLPNVSIYNLNMYSFLIQNTQRYMHIDYYTCKLDKYWFLTYFQHSIHSLNSLHIYIDINVYDIFVRFPSMYRQVYSVYEKYMEYHFPTDEITRYINQWKQSHDYILSLQPFVLKYKTDIHDINSLSRDFFLCSNHHIETITPIQLKQEHKMIDLYIYMKEHNWEWYHMNLFHKIIKYNTYKLYLKNNNE